MPRTAKGCGVYNYLQYDQPGYIPHQRAVGTGMKGRGKGRKPWGPGNPLYDHLQRKKAAKGHGLVGDKIRGAVQNRLSSRPALQRVVSGVADRIKSMRGSGIRVSHHGQVSESLPQALRSKPYGANFLFSTQLPPDYQKFNTGVKAPGGTLCGC
jgi:hypothetical protein